MNRKYMKISGAILVGISILGAGYFLGVQNSNRKADDVQNTAIEASGRSVNQGSNIINRSKTVAIVNLDEGIREKDSQMNYGSFLIHTLTSDIKVTGLEEARQGIVDGRYGACLIIPNTFSNNLSKLEDKPEKSTLNYAIGPGVTTENREFLIQEISNIYSVFRDNLSKIYTASILKEYHQVQDAADSIMKRDSSDMERLLAVSGENLVDIIEIPILKDVKREIKPLDLSKNCESNQNHVTNISAAYQDNINKGAGDYDVIKNQASTLEEKAADAKTKLTITQSGINKINIKEHDDAQRAEDEDVFYTNSKGNVVGKDGILELYNQNLSTFNSAVKDQTAKFQYAEANYKRFLQALADAKACSSQIESEVQSLSRL